MWLWFECKILQQRKLETNNTFFTINQAVTAGNPLQTKIPSLIKWSSSCTYLYGFFASSLLDVTISQWSQANLQEPKIGQMISRNSGVHMIIKSDSVVANIHFNIDPFHLACKTTRHDVISFHFFCLQLTCPRHFISPAVTWNTTINRRSLGFLLCNLYWDNIRRMQMLFYISQSNPLPIV